MAREPRTADIVAEMVANVMTVAVEPGDSVATGDTVVLLESMKMEIPVESPVSGRVTEILVGAPEKIDEGQVLLRIEVR
jgi:acetyl-CoA carboxylase biotin carboxyl carrier protein